MKDFEKTFQDTLDQLEADAKREGLTLTSICRDTGVSRATPDRWRKQPPKTIEILKRMQGIVETKRQENLKAAANALHHD